MYRFIIKINNHAINNSPPNFEAPIIIFLHPRTSAVPIILEGLALKAPINVES